VEWTTALRKRKGVPVQVTLPSFYCASSLKANSGERDRDIPIKRSVAGRGGQTVMLGSAKFHQEAVDYR